MQPVLPPGLRLISGFITDQEEKILIQNVDNMPWNDALKRRTQHYGFNYDYKSRGLTKALPIPEWCNLLWPKMRTAGLIPPGKSAPEQLIVNEYEPGQGISSHTDSPIFGDIIMSLSLGSSCVMVFTGPNNERIDVHLDRKSLVVMSGEARGKWKHEIPARKSDVLSGNKVVRERRISFTFRYV